jgi:hypothetical protein
MDNSHTVVLRHEHRVSLIIYYTLYIMNLHDAVVSHGVHDSCLPMWLASD